MRQPRSHSRRLSTKLQRATSSISISRSNDSKLLNRVENAKYIKITSDGTVQETNAEGGLGREQQQQQILKRSPFLDALFLASSLSALHFTLKVLTVHQYVQELHFRLVQPLEEDHDVLFRAECEEGQRVFLHKFAEVKLLL